MPRSGSVLVLVIKCEFTLTCLRRKDNEIDPIGALSFLITQPLHKVETSSNSSLTTSDACQVTFVASGKNNKRTSHLWLSDHCELLNRSALPKSRCRKKQRRQSRPPDLVGSLSDLGPPIFVKINNADAAYCRGGPRDLFLGNLALHRAPLLYVEA